MRTQTQANVQGKVTKTKNETDDLLRLASQLYYVDRLEEQKVAKIVGVSRSTVSRLLLRARERGIVRISVDSFEPRNTDLEEKLKVCFGLNHSLVIKTNNARTASDARRMLGYFAAPHVSLFVRPRSIVGVAGGRSVSEFAQAIAPQKNAEAITVVQLMGNVGPTISGADAVEISRLIANRFGGVYYTINAPAVVPDITSRNIFLNHDDVRSVWELFNQMQTAFIGIGTLSDSVFIDRGIFASEDLKRLEDFGAVGEICGRFFDADGKESASDYGNRVISIPLDTLRHVKEVVALTSGADRARAAVAAVRGGICKSLIVDEACALAMLQATDGQAA